MNTRLLALCFLTLLLTTSSLTGCNANSSISSRDTPQGILEKLLHNMAEVTSYTADFTTTTDAGYTAFGAEASFAQNQSTNELYGVMVVEEEFVIELYAQGDNVDVLQTWGERSGSETITDASVLAMTSKQIAVLNIPMLTDINNYEDLTVREIEEYILLEGSTYISELFSPTLLSILYPRTTHSLLNRPEATIVIAITKSTSRIETINLQYDEPFMDTILKIEMTLSLENINEVESVR